MKRTVIRFTRTTNLTGHLGGVHLIVEDFNVVTDWHRSAMPEPIGAALCQGADCGPGPSEARRHK